MVSFLKILAAGFLLLGFASAVFAFYRGQWCARTKVRMLSGEVIYLDALVGFHKQSVFTLSLFLLLVILCVEVTVRLGGFEESPLLWRAVHYVCDGFFALNFAAALITGARYRNIHRYFVYFLPITALFVAVTGFPMFLGWV